MLYQVKLSYATYGIETDLSTGLVINVAPIASWMLGKSFSYVKLWVMSKGGTVELVLPTTAISNTAEMEVVEYPKVEARFPVGQCKHCGQSMSPAIADGVASAFCSYDCFCLD